MAITMHDKFRLDNSRQFVESCRNETQVQLHPRASRGATVKKNDSLLAFISGSEDN